MAHDDPGLCRYCISGPAPVGANFTRSRTLIKEYLNSTYSLIHRAQVLAPYFLFGLFLLTAWGYSGGALAESRKGLSRAGSAHTDKVLVLSPRSARRSHETHAALMLSKKSFDEKLHFSGRIQTSKQLRRGSPPNPWECAWVVWHYGDNHFYYLILKQNGWEVGRHDPTVKGGQIFLRTGEQSFPLNKWHRFDVRQNAGEISVSVDDVEITRFVEQSPLTAGKIGFYTEDAEIWVDNIRAPFIDDFDHYAAGTTRRDGSTLQNWVITYLGHGYAAIKTQH